MIAKAIIRKADKLYKNPLTVPVCLPDLADVKRLAFDLHDRKQKIQGEYAGWSFHYLPKDDQPPVDSSLTFTPATFILGSWPIWSVSIDWEKGDDQDPSIFVWDKGIVKQ